MDAPGHFHRKKIYPSAPDCCRRHKQIASANRVWRKRHSVWKTIAARRIFPLKCHKFRREFKQFAKQLARVCAFVHQYAVFPILSQLIAALSPIDLGRTLVNDALRQHSRESA
jgi:hypothetical protein